MIGLDIDSRPVRRPPPLLQRLDIPLLCAAAAILSFGLLSLYSYQHSHPGDQTFQRQLLFLALGLIPFGVFLVVEPHWWRRVAPWLYGLNLALLVAVAVAGRSGKGAERWLEIGPIQFQPSELSKLFLVLTLAAYFSNRTSQAREWSTFLGSFLHAAPVILLVFLQPHLGAALALGVVWLSVCLYAGVPWRRLGATLGAAVALLLFAVFVPGILADYQKERFFGHFYGGDKRGSAYQQDQAAIAFAVGGINGQGYLKGERKRDGYIPEQQNDFVATILGEEGGFVGFSLLLASFGFLFYRIWHIGYSAREPFAKMVAGGLLGVLGFHTVVNLGMNLGLLPVVGLWLPFMSAGGTALWFCMSAVGLLARLRIQDDQRFFHG